MGLASFRESRGLTVQQAAESLGLKGRGYLSDIERGVVHAPIRLALRIQDWSGGAVRAESLVSREDADLLRRFVAEFAAPPPPASGQGAAA